MTIHLIKLCVGVESVDHLRRLQEQRKRTSPRLFHRTRMIPRRVDELLDGGSLYWVIKGFTAVRQPLLALDTGKGEDGRAYCDLVLGDNVVVVGQPRRPFQGWRYLAPQDVPPDLTTGTDGEPLPEDMARELRALGLI